jgi:hypothetical protein
VAELLPAGPAAAAAAALAAGLAELTASVVGDAQIAARASALRRRAEVLGPADAEAYSAYLADPGERTRGRTIAVPLRISQLAAETAELAVRAAEAARSPVAADAAAGAVLARAAAEIGALLVTANAGRDDPRVARASASAERATAAATRALAAGSR